MKYRSLSFIFFLFGLSPYVLSQSTDFGIWYKFSIEHSLGKKLDVKISPSVRTFNNASEIEQAFFEGEVSYKIIKYLSISGAYRFIEYKGDNSKYHIRHRWLAEIKGKGDIGQFDLSGRFRVQRRDKTYFEDDDDEVPDYHGRLRFKTVYKTPSFPVNPGVSFETFSRIFETSEKFIDKYRFSLGCEYSINKKNSFKIEYMFERDYLPQLMNINLIALTYDFKL